MKLIVPSVSVSGGAISTQDEGTPLSSSVNTLNFTGTGVTASGAGTTTIVNIPGNTSGTFTLNFGLIPGTNIVSTAVADSGIGASSHVQLYLMGTDSTATHNATEHAILPLDLSLSCISITAGVGFTAQAATRLRLTGTFTARYIRAD